MEVTTGIKRRQSDIRAVMRKREAIEPREDWSGSRQGRESGRLQCGDRIKARSAQVPAGSKCTARMKKERPGNWEIRCNLKRVLFYTS